MEFKNLQNRHFINEGILFIKFLIYQPSNIDVNYDFFKCKRMLFFENISIKYLRFYHLTILNFDII